MQVKETKKHLKCELTEDELREYGSDLARHYSEIADLESQKKGVSSDFKSRIEIKEAEATSLARKIQNGYEYRDVDCEIQSDYNEKVVRTVRLDTGEIIGERVMTPDKLQQSFLAQDPPEEEEAFEDEGETLDEEELVDAEYTEDNS